MASYDNALVKDSDQRADQVFGSVHSLMRMATLNNPSAFLIHFGIETFSAPVRKNPSDTCRNVQVVPFSVWETIRFGNGGPSAYEAQSQGQIQPRVPKRLTR